MEQHNPFYNKDLFLLICFNFHWRELSILRSLSKMNKKMIDDNAGNLVTSVCNKEEKIKKGQKIILRKDIFKINKNEYFKNCYCLDFSNLADFDWHLLCQFDNRCHYLSLIGSPFADFNVINHHTYVSLGDILVAGDEQKIIKFMQKNFIDRDIELFFQYYRGHNWLNTRREFWRKYPFYHCNEITDKEICDKLLLPPTTIFTLETCANFPEDSELYVYFIEKIRKDITKIKQITKNYEHIKSWFATAKINVINLSGTNVPAEIVECMTG